MNQLQEQIELVKIKEKLAEAQPPNGSPPKNKVASTPVLAAAKNTLSRFQNRIYAAILYAKNTLSSLFLLFRKDERDEENLRKPIFPVPISPPLFSHRDTLPTLDEIAQTRKLQKQHSNLILWDIENISCRYIDEILHHFDSPSDIIVVSALPLQKNQTYILYPYILLYGITVQTGHTDSDLKLIELMKKHHHDYKTITIVSSDTDFIPYIKTRLRKKKRVRVIVRDDQKKGMIMRLNLDNRYLSIKTLYGRAA